MIHDIKEDWDNEPVLPAWGIPLGAWSVLPSHEDEWKLMADQDPQSGSIAGDSGHGTMTVTSEIKPSNDNEELIGAVVGIDGAVTGEFEEDITTEHPSDVLWREEDPYIQIEDENVTIPE